MNLSDWRTEIDEIDNGILTLLQRRAAIAASIGEAKARAGLPIADRERETEIRRRIAEKCQKPLSVNAVEKIFGTILHESRRIQSEKQIAPEAGQKVIL